ncbi:MAG: ParB/RepB/Spo0J family partition protein, partial [Candidatus Bathyarchaeia archaeon]
PIRKIAVPSDLCRVHVARDDSLVQTIKSHGIVQPLTVRPSGEGFELVCGYRQLVHAKEAGLTVVPCVVKEMSDLEAAEATFIENLERQDLTDYEKGRCLSF